ncbi:MAG: hypothetical protein ACI83D_000590 [Planctomycetota bacterium]|jgi:hypothetical protein
MVNLTLLLLGAPLDFPKKFLKGKNSLLMFGGSKKYILLKMSDIQVKTESPCVIHVNVTTPRGTTKRSITVTEVYALSKIGVLVKVNSIQMAGFLKDTGSAKVVYFAGVQTAALRDEWRQNAQIEVSGKCVFRGKKTPD